MVVLGDEAEAGMTATAVVVVCPATVVVVCPGTVVVVAPGTVVVVSPWNWVVGGIGRVVVVVVAAEHASGKVVVRLTDSWPNV
jgi:hypothetical protein